MRRSSVKKFLQKMVESKDDVGTVRNFWVNADYNAEGTGSTITATCRAVTEHAYIYVSDNSWNTTYANQTFVDNIANAWENEVPTNPNKGIYEMDVDLFGTPPDVDGEERIFILIFNIKEGVLGYFAPTNEYPGQGNGKEILHIDSNTASGTSNILLATVAHEVSTYDSF